MSGTNLPALGNPIGMTTDFAHPRDALRTVLLVTQCLCIPIVSVLIVLRLYVRFRFQQKLQADESLSLGFFLWDIVRVPFCVSALDPACSQIMLTIGLVWKYGGGCYQRELYRSEVVKFLKISYIAALFYASMALFVKMALLTLLARVFKPYHKRVIIIYLILGLVLAYYIPAFIIKARICSPVSAYWNGTDSGGSCLNQGKLIMADSIMSVVTDLAILILPLLLTWSLQMPLEKKLKVIGLLSAGGLATGFSLYRLVIIVRDGQSPDPIMVFTRVVLTGNAEGAVGLICACLPALNVLITQESSYYQQQESHLSSRLQLGTLRRSKNTRRSKINQNVEDGTAFRSDGRFLKSHVDASHSDHVSADHIPFGRIIMRSVAISQSVKMMDTRT